MMNLSEVDDGGRNIGMLGHVVSVIRFTIYLKVILYNKIKTWEVFIATFL